jgi:predicted nucleic acid-binding protein
MFLADTNIISELVRLRPNPGVLAWADTVSDIAVSVITVEEVCYGLSWKPNQRIRVWFESFFDRCSILPVTLEIARLCGHLRGQLQSRGANRAQAEILIAATAQIHQLTLVTRNLRDFDGCQLTLLNPFT